MARAPSRPLFDGIYPSAISIGKGRCLTSICGTPERAGTCRTARRSSRCRNSAVGSQRRWCGAMRISPRITWRRMRSACAQHVRWRTKPWHVLASPENSKGLPSASPCYWLRGQDLNLRPSGYEARSGLVTSLQLKHLSALAKYQNSLIKAQFGHSPLGLVTTHVKGHCIRCANYRVSQTTASPIETLLMHLKRKFDDQSAGRARRPMSSADNCRRPSEVDSIRAMPDALSAAKKTPQVRRPREPGPRKPPRPPQSNPRIPPRTIEPRPPKVRTQ